MFALLGIVARELAERERAVTLPVVGETELAARALDGREVLRGARGKGARLRADTEKDRAATGKSQSGTLKMQYTEMRSHSR